MLPVAFACPLWWVARWAVRLLTGFAVAAAFVLGSGALPATASPEPAVAARLTAPAPASDVLACPWAAAPACGAEEPATDPVLAGPDHADASIVVGGPLPAAGQVATAAGPVRAPASTTPGASGPRAPPRG